MLFFSLLVSLFVINNADDECWSVDYVGQSTQFRLMNTCQNSTDNTTESTKWIKIKMSSLIEYNTNDKATQNKESSFANSDYNWENPDCNSDNGCLSVRRTYIFI